ncbi:hypothetical protein LX36DRAFT_653809 [Colletotrichum falcatum]|nr:hypothetical protein LX36DRAFT_653809 [Colletotrichum falcatum]
MHALASSVLAAVLFAATAAAQRKPDPFTQEYHLVDGAPCTATANPNPGSFFCSDNGLNTTLTIAPDNLPAMLDPNAAQGVKFQCGGPESFTYFVQFGGVGFAVFDGFDGCKGKNLTAATSVRALNNFTIPFVQELTFTDGAACTKGADGVFDCPGGASIETRNGTMLMVSTSGADTAIRATCAAGSSVFFMSGMNAGVVKNPSVCGDGIASANSVSSRVAVDDS